MQPKISVVIPSFNKVRYIKETLDSIFLQKYSNLEVIIQDGGSTDGTLEIIKQFAKIHPKEISWQSKKDNGQFDAINRGLSKATGDILAFINADDVYESDTFEIIAEAYRQHPAALWLAGHGKIINEGGNEIAKFWSACKNILLSLNSHFLLLATSNYLVQPSVFITRKAYQKYGPFTGVGKHVFEYELWLKLGKVSMPVVLRKNLAKFRAGGANMTSVFNDTIFAKDMQVAKKYSGNFVIIFLHYINNSIRILVNKYI